MLHSCNPSHHSNKHLKPFSLIRMQIAWLWMNLGINLWIPRKFTFLYIEGPGIKSKHNNNVPCGVVYRIKVDFVFHFNQKSRVFFNACCGWKSTKLPRRGVSPAIQYTCMPRTRKKYNSHSKILWIYHAPLIIKLTFIRNTAKTVHVHF